MPNTFCFVYNEGPFSMKKWSNPNRNLNIRTISMQKWIWDADGNKRIFSTSWCVTDTVLYLVLSNVLNILSQFQLNLNDFRVSSFGFYIQSFSPQQKPKRALRG